MKPGDKVYISDQSSFKDQGIKNGVKLIGTIKSERSYSRWKYEVKWENGSGYLYDDEDLELANIELNYEIY